MKNYDQSNCYELKVIDIFIDDDTQFYIVEDESTKYKVRSFDFQKKLKRPSSITCRIIAFEADGSPVFEQDRYRLLLILYTVGDTYSFKVGLRSKSPGRGKDFYFLYDNHGFTFKLPVWEKESLGDSKRIFCQVTEIMLNGTLKLKPETDSIILKSNFISYNQLFQILGTGAEVEEVSFTALKQEKDKNTKINSLFLHYERCNGLWIIGYISLLATRRKIAVNQGHYPLADKLNRLYNQIAEWIIEDSDFLTVYSPEMISSLRLRIEEELEIAKIQLHAYSLICSDQAETYFSKIVNKITVSGYLCNRKVRIKTILCLLHFCQDLLNSRPADFLFFVHYLSKQKEDTDIREVQEVINQFILRESTELNVFMNAEEVNEAITKRIQIVVRYIAVSLLLNKKSPDIRIQRSMLYRCLSYLETPENRSVFIRKSFNALFSAGGYSFEFGWEDILHFNASLFVPKVRSFINAEEIPYSGKQLFSTPYGNIMADSQKITIFPREQSTLSLSEIAPLFNGRICIGVPKKEKKNWTETSDLGKLRKQWDNLQTLFNQYIPLLSTTPKEELSAGKSLLVRVQGFNKNYPQMIFVDIEDKYYKGTGVLHVSNIARYFVTNLEDVFFTNDIFRVTVVSNEDGKIQLGLLDELDKMAASNLNPGDHVVAKLIRVNKNNYAWVNENGYIFYTEKSDDYLFRPGMSGSLLVDGIMADNRIEATFIEESTIEIDEIDALKSVIEEYISYSQVEELNQDIEEKEVEEEMTDMKEDMEESRNFPLINTEFIRELIYLQFLSASCLKDPVERYMYIGTARLLSSISDYKHYVEFFQQYMNYEEALYHFLYDKIIGPASFKLAVTDELVIRFPIMKQWQQIAQILSSWNKSDTEDKLQSFIKENNRQIANLSRLVLSNNLLCHVAVNKNTLLSLKGEITHLLNTEINNESISPVEQEIVQLVNLGLEDGEREFKTSLVYLAGSGTNANMSQQTMIILRTIAGFLNANGGTLYIGVHDTGDVTGLKPDFDYMKCGADGYERLLRSRIVHSFGKDINSLISFKFVTYDNRMVCEISIPRYSKLVPLGGIIWQRQGNETRMLDGVSLRLQEERRQQEEELLKSSHVETQLSVALKASMEKKNAKAKKEKRTVNLIPTSLLRPNPLNHTENNLDDNTVAYWSLLENDEYIITDELPHMAGIVCTLAIQENESDGYLLLGYENGFVNKVSMKTILSKKRKYSYKSGKAKETQLMFISVASNDDDLFIRTFKNETEFYKLFPIKLLKINTDLSHKGSPVFSFNFGVMLQWDVVPASLVEQVERLQNSLLTYQGLSGNSTGFEKEKKFIDEHFSR